MKQYITPTVTIHSVQHREIVTTSIIIDDDIIVDDQQAPFRPDSDWDTYSNH